VKDKTGIENIEVIDYIGHGAYGAVFSGFDLDNCRPVALKIVETEDNTAVLEKAQREAEIQMNLNSEYIVKCYRFVIQPRQVVSIMELADQ